MRQRKKRHINQRKLPKLPLSLFGWSLIKFGTGISVWFKVLPPVEIGGNYYWDYDEGGYHDYSLDAVGKSDAA